MVQACVAPSARATDTNAVIPYKTLDDMFQPIEAVDPAKLESHVAVVSRNKAVHPADITLTIQSARAGMIPVTVSTNGRILNFPHDKNLLRENPPVVSNQPKGTLNLMVSMQLPPPEGLTFRYGRLGDGVAEINKAIRAQAGMMLSLVAPKAEGVVFLFPKASAGKATVEIASATGRREYTADAHGHVTLKLEPALLKENPEVTVSEKPPRIVPDMK
jgi:hypothetical protein